MSCDADKFSSFSSSFFKPIPFMDGDEENEDTNCGAETTSSSFCLVLIFFSSSVTASSFTIPGAVP